jgi:hypothetical protein
VFCEVHNYNASERCRRSYHCLVHGTCSRSPPKVHIASMLIRG